MRLGVYHDYTNVIYRREGARPTRRGRVGGIVRGVHRRVLFLGSFFWGPFFWGPFFWGPFFWGPFFGVLFFGVLFFGSLCGRFRPFWATFGRFGPFFRSRGGKVHHSAY